MIKKKILLRADGNSHVGLGHVYRCIAIAEMLKEDFVCEFLISAQSSFENVIPSYFSVKNIPEDISIQQENLWIKHNYDLTSTIIIIDGYQFNSTYQKELKTIGIKSIYIDDLAAEYMFADVIINHAPSAKELVYSKENNTKLCLGADYAILRPIFLQKAKTNPSAFKPIQSVLITLGGSDEHNVTLKTIEALLPLNQIQTLNIVIGAAFKHKSLLQQVISQTKKNITLHSNLSEKDMVALMQSSDAAIAPCSTTCLELFAINKPIFSGFTAENQVNLYNYFAQNYLIFDCKNLQTIPTKALQEIIELNLDNEDEINKMLILQRQLINGESAKKIKEIVSNLFS